MYQASVVQDKRAKSALFVRRALFCEQTDVELNLHIRYAWADAIKRTSAWNFLMRTKGPAHKRVAGCLK
jgi:hypothetical protein